MTRASLPIVAFLGLSACQDAERLRVSCDAGDATACHDLGLRYEAGAGVTQDLARAASFCLRRRTYGGLLQGWAHV